ncbi:uncharacterized protein TM35_000461780 [Trypanosoma theileri]|uniref:Transglutaminase n=1 Tax=Trypanosoma theileri TaxID=67003 RepID=A0A1X0NJK3_9TRYP|nr:uncharacterized protein TM35_000461780 [Trypanosoma theileri]ORC84359.1 hypothetical protein TM35_000461780 [Trypanosoma theileri]
MTTMFIQLRRVVYLLVLLQCCVCVSYADPSGRVAADGLKRDEEVLDEHQDVLAAENKARAWINTVDEHLAEGRGYSAVWEEVVNSTNASSQLANSTAMAVKELVEELDKKAVVKGGTKYKMVDGDENKIKELVQKIKEAVTNTESRVYEVWGARWHGLPSLGTLEDAVRDFNETREYYLRKLAEANVTYWTPDKIKIAKDSNKTYHELFAITEKYVKLNGLSIVTESEVRGRIKEVQNTMEGVKNKLTEIKTNKVEGDAGKIDGILSAIKEIDTPCKNVLKAVDARPIGTAKPKKGVTIGVRMKAEKKRIKELIPVERKAEADRLAKEEQARKDEAARQERERQEKLKEEQRLARERERMAQEEMERKKKAAAEEAEKRKADEKRAEEEKAKQDQERKEAEEKAQGAREALKKKEKEQLERAAEEAKKKAEATKRNDNSYSPALAHSPLLLLLLCVLGYTLVC